MRVATNLDERKRRVFVHGDAIFSGMALPDIVEEAGCEVVSGGGRDFSVALDDVSPPLDLIVLQLDPEPSGTLKSLAMLREREWFGTVPILAVSSVDRSNLDIWQLRALGVVGLVDGGAPPEHVRFRVGQCVYRGREGRRFVRAPCSVPVEVDVDGVLMAARAVSVSVGGLGLACPRPIEPNTRVGLRFSVGEGEDPVELLGRTVHLRETQNVVARYEVGLFFFRLTDPLYDTINTFVSRSLATWDLDGDAREPGPSPIHSGKPR